MKKMKKVLAATLAATMVMSTGITVLADTASGNIGNPNVSVTKEYKLGSNSSIDVSVKSPAEEFKFSSLEFVSVKDAGVLVTDSWIKANLPTINSVSYDKGEATVEGVEKKATITLPTDYPGVGVYTYKFKEIANNYAGVTYRDEYIYLVVTVTEDESDTSEAKYRVAAVHTEVGPDGVITPGTAGTAPKSDLFTNTYEAGSLSVTKEVTGNMGDKDKEFEVYVTFEAPVDENGNKRTVMSDITIIDNTGTNSINNENIAKLTAGTGWTDSLTVTLNLKDGETVQFDNIPYGVTYTVTEKDYYSNDILAQDGTVVEKKYDAPKYATKEGNVEVVKNAAFVDATDGTGKMDNHLEAVQITNNRESTVDTGISLDSMPYLMMLALSFLGFFGFVSKKRKIEF